MLIYVSGRINGNPQHEIEFRKAALEITMNPEHRAIVPQDIPPHEHDGPCPPSYAEAPGGHTAACYLRTGLAALLTCDAIYLLRGWEKSVGARLEFSVAAMCGLEIMYQEVIELQKQVRVRGESRGYNLGGLHETMGGPPPFTGDASRLFERRYDGDE